MGDNLGDSDNRSIASIYHQLASGGLHAFSADAENFDVRQAAFKGVNELGAVHLARSLAGGDQQAQRTAH